MRRCEELHPRPLPVSAWELVVFVDTEWLMPRFWRLMIISLLYHHASFICGPSPNQVSPKSFDFVVDLSFIHIYTRLRPPSYKLVYKSHKCVIGLLLLFQASISMYNPSYKLIAIYLFGRINPIIYCVIDWLLYIFLGGWSADLRDIPSISCCPHWPRPLSASLRLPSLIASMWPRENQHVAGGGSRAFFITIQFTSDP